VPEIEGLLTDVAVMIVTPGDKVVIIPVVWFMLATDGLLEVHVTLVFVAFEGATDFVS
jgi:hypothetical protein